MLYFFYCACKKSGFLVTGNPEIRTPHQDHVLLAGSGIQCILLCLKLVYLYCGQAQMFQHTLFESKLHNFASSMMYQHGLITRWWHLTGDLVLTEKHVVC